MEYPKFKVCCRCFTFNHSKYITDAMNGFTMQQTSFPFVCTIVDDASTDGEQEVIRKYVENNFDFSEGSVAFHKETAYAHITYAQHKTNKNCYFAVLYLKENHYSQKKPKMDYLSEWRDMCEYEALCEGDDYWIVPDKLEKQVMFLSKYKDFSLCGSNGIIVWEYGDNPPSYFNQYFENRELTPDCIIGHWSMPTASLLYRMSVKNDYPSWTKKIYSGDQTLILIALSKGKIFCFGSLSTIYRKSNINKLSLSTKYSKGANGYVQRQHLLLYKEYQNYVGNRFEKVLNEHIKKLEKDVRFYDHRNKYSILAYIINYKFTIKNSYKILKYKLMKKLK